MEKEVQGVNINFNSEFDFAKEYYKEAIKGFEEDAPPDPVTWLRHGDQLAINWEQQKVSMIELLEREGPEAIPESDKETIRQFLSCYTAVYMDLMASLWTTFNDVIDFSTLTEDSYLTRAVTELAEWGEDSSELILGEESDGTEYNEMEYHENEEENDLREHEQEESGDIDSSEAEDKSESVSESEELVEEDSEQTQEQVLSSEVESEEIESEEESSEEDSSEQSFSDSVELSDLDSLEAPEY